MRTKSAQTKVIISIYTSACLQPYLYHNTARIS